MRFPKACFCVLPYVLMFGYFIYLQTDLFNHSMNDASNVEKKATAEASSLYQNVQDSLDKILNADNVSAMHKRRIHGSQVVFMKELKEQCQDYSPCVVDKLKVRDLELNNYYQRYRTN